MRMNNELRFEIFKKNLQLIITFGNFNKFT